MGRKKNHDTAALEVVPTCPNSHTLNRRVADGDYECDTCQADIANGCCFYGCAPCDYSLCAGCYVKLATGTLGGAAAGASSQAATSGGATDLGGPGPIDPDVADLCDHYQIEDRIMMKLNDVMKARQDTFGRDIEKLWEELETARCPAGLLMAKIRQMHEGTFVGKMEPPKDVLRIIEKYRLDHDARTKLADFICKRPESAKYDLYEIERRLENSGRPSAIVMTMIVALHQGKKLPEIQRMASHRDYADLPNRNSNAAASHRDQDRYRERDRERDRASHGIADRGERRGGGGGDRDGRRSRSRDKR